MSYGRHISLNPGHRPPLGNLRQFLAEHDDLPDDTQVAATIAWSGWSGEKWTRRETPADG